MLSMGTRMATTITMTTAKPAAPRSDPLALSRLLTWLSPAFPVGAFAYSQGLETEISKGWLTSDHSLRNWCAVGLSHGGLRNDALLVSASHRAGADASALLELADLCLALTPAHERRAELVALGEAFIEAARAWPHPDYAAFPASPPYPIAVGAVAASHGIDATDTLVGFLTAQIQSQISVGLRLIPLGQSAGLAIQSALEPDIIALAQFAAETGLEGLGGIAHGAEIAMMNHERLESRIFKS